MPLRAQASSAGRSRKPRQTRHRRHGVHREDHEYSSGNRPTCKGKKKNSTEQTENVDEKKGQGQEVDESRVGSQKQARQPKPDG